MCRLCMIYDRIEISTLPMSNPWMDLETEQPEVLAPNNIIVQSPESSRHTAWTNYRYPSLQRLSIDSDMSSSSTDSRRAKMGRRDSYRGVDMGAARSPRWASPVATYTPVTQRKAVPGSEWTRDRPRRGSSSTGSTPEATSPVLGSSGPVQYRAYNPQPVADPRAAYYRPYSRYRSGHNGSMNGAMNVPMGQPESPSDYINNLTRAW